MCLSPSKYWRLVHVILTIILSIGALVLGVYLAEKFSLPVIDRETLFGHIANVVMLFPIYCVLFFWFAADISTPKTFSACRARGSSGGSLKDVHHAFVHRFCIPPLRCGRYNCWASHANPIQGNCIFRPR